MENFGWAIIGCGKIARKAAKSIAYSGAGKIVSVWNRTAARAEKFAGKYGGKVCKTAKDAVLCEGVNCVYVATTHDKHEFFSELSLNCGVPVLCEKPVAVNFKQAEKMFSLAKEKGVYLAEGMWTWHNPVSLKVKEWVEGGTIGKIKRVFAVFSFPMMYMTKNPRLTKPELIGGVLLDIGIYPIRYVYELFGYPKRISCEGKLINGIDADDKITMQYDGFEAVINTSMRKLRGEKVVIEGTEGKITVPYFHTAVSAKLSGKRNEKFKGIKNPMGAEFTHTAQDILSGAKESGHCPIKSTLDTMRLLDECRAQTGVVYPCEKA